MSTNTSALPDRKDPPTGIVRLANLLPLWLCSLAITVEGFPRPPISPEAAVGAFIGALAISVLLIWRGWATVEVVLYSLFPLLLLAPFDEISTAYKTPFIALCALSLTIGLMVYQRARAARWQRLLLLLGFAGATYALAHHAIFNFWEMAAQLGYSRCFPEAHGCAPLPSQAPSWLALFFIP